MGPDSGGERRLFRVLARKPDGHHRQILRPLVLGPAVLYQPAGKVVWRVDLADTEALVPHVPASRRDLMHIIGLHSAVGHTCRLALALASPMDATTRRRSTLCGSLDDSEFAARSDIYGWSIMYQRPGCSLEGIVDPHDEYSDLPAFYESASELLDRTDYLSWKQIPHRVLALATRPEDFEWPFDRVLRRNRFFPESRFAAPTDITRLVT